MKGYQFTEFRYKIRFYVIHDSLGNQFLLLWFVDFMHFEMV